MAKLYFRYGAMGSSKTANAIMVRYNYMERGQSALMLKPALEKRDGVATVKSRCGLSSPCEYVENLDKIDVGQYDCLIVDDAQFLSKEQVEKLAAIADFKNIPVICYGLRADFKGDLFPGSQWLFAWADAIEEVKTVCWCGKKATFNARIRDGKVERSGEQIMLGGNESYVSLCRKHYCEGNLGVKEIRRIDADKKRYIDMLIDADPCEYMIDKYLDQGDMYVLFENGWAASEIVAVKLADGSCEIKNLATVPDKRRRGYASSLIRHLMSVYGDCPTMYVGTAEGGVGFYERLGFTRDHVIPNFFTDNYPEAVYDEGVLLTDMVVLSLKL